MKKVIKFSLLLLFLYSCSVSYHYKKIGNNAPVKQKDSLALAKRSGLTFPIKNDSTIEIISDTIYIPDSTSSVLVSKSIDSLYKEIEFLTLLINSVPEQSTIEDSLKRDLKNSYILELNKKTSEIKNKIKAEVQKDCDAKFKVIRETRIKTYTGVDTKTAARLYYLNTTNSNLTDENKNLSLVLKDIKSKLKIRFWIIVSLTLALSTIVSLKIYSKIKL